LRAHVGHSKVILVYASALILDERGQVLLQRRSDFSWWGLPGGVVERGETLAECVLREVREETGLQVEIKRLIGVYSSPDFDVTYPNADEVQQFTACFECRISGGLQRPDGDEVLELVSFPLDDLPDVPPWYLAMIEDQTSGAVEASFRKGQAGRLTSENHYIWLRKFVGHEPVTMVGASAYVRDEAGKVLLVRRADDGSWSLPAGAMELGERIDRTAEREVFEETGLEIQPERLVGIYSGPGFFHTYPNGDQVHIVTNLFTCRVTGGMLQPDGREIVQASFFAPDQLPPLIARHQIRITDTLADRKGAVWI
jgi:ADP-ribose pyrophosphatase YjhB (NUDIX family)